MSFDNWILIRFINFEKWTKIKILFNDQKLARGTDFKFKEFNRQVP